MLSLEDGARAWRAWRNYSEQQRENSQPVDTVAMRAGLERTRPGAAALLSGLHCDGAAVIEDYWPQERCAQARAELDALMQREPGCVRRFSNDSDRRVFGAETAGPAIRAFHDDLFLKSIGETEGGFALYNLATLGARIDAMPGNRGSGDGWHRDAFGFQFKAIIYLCDVTVENGPFEYLCGSHKAWRACFDSVLGRFPAPPNSRIDSEHMERMIADGTLTPKQFTAKAGTVILANTTGVHGGAPLKEGHRYALTNYYYFPYQIGQSMINKFLPLPDGALERLEPLLESERQARLLASGAE
jgi:hypothetical protein